MDKLNHIRVWYVPTGGISEGREALFATNSDGMFSTSHNLQCLQKYNSVETEHCCFHPCMTRKWERCLFTIVNWAVPIMNARSFSVCGKTNVLHYSNVLLEMYQHMYPVIICLLHVSAQEVVTLHFILLVLLLILCLEVW